MPHLLSRGLRPRTHGGLDRHSRKRRARRGLRPNGVRRHQARNRSPRARGQDRERRHRRHLRGGERLARDGVRRRDARTRGCVADRAIGLRRRTDRELRRRRWVSRPRPATSTSRPCRAGTSASRPCPETFDSASRAAREPGSTPPRCPDDSSRSSDSRIRSPRRTEGAAAAVVPLHVKTVSGDVSIVRAAAAYSA